MHAVEDDQFKSRYIYSLIHESKGTPKTKTSKIPKTLVQFWDNATSVPQDVSECMQSWLPLKNQGFEYILFDEYSAKSFIAQHFDRRHLSAFERCIHPAMKSDYFRLCFLLCNGGIYIDANDVYKGVGCEFLFLDNRIKLHPLCYRISSNSMVSDDDLKLSAYTNDLIFYVNNNPIVAPPNHPLIKIALEHATQKLTTKGLNLKDIQSVTGPGNLTTALIQYVTDIRASGNIEDFSPLTNWDTVAMSKWPLGYRNDERNWRLWANSKGSSKNQ